MQQLLVKKIQIITYINLPKAMVFFPTSYSDTIPRHIFLCAVSKEHLVQGSQH